VQKNFPALVNGLKAAVLQYKSSTSEDVTKDKAIKEWYFECCIRKTVSILIERNANGRQASCTNIYIGVFFFLRISFEMLVFVCICPYFAISDATGYCISNFCIIKLQCNT